MSKKISISIIIPTYNVEKYIQKLLKDILENDTDFCEIIIVDDGSTDYTIERVQEMNMDNLVLIKQVNEGVSVARNVGIDNAKGEYVLFLDGDDTVSSDLLVKVKEKINQYHADMIVWQHDIKKNERKYELSYCKLPEKMTGIDFFPKVLYQQYRLCMGTFAIRKELLDEHKIRFTPKCYYAEDLEFLFSSVIIAKTVVIINDILYTYIRHTGSAMYHYNIKRFDAPMAVIRIAKRIREENLTKDTCTKELKYIERDYFVQQFIFSMESCLQYIDYEILPSFWNEVEVQYPGLLLKAQKTIRKAKYKNIAFDSRKLFLLKISIKWYSKLLLYYKKWGNTDD